MPDRAAPSDQALASAPDRALKPTACIALADGQIFWGRGLRRRSRSASSASTPR